MKLDETVKMTNRNSHQDEFLQLLKSYINQDLIIAFSGGVDSTLLAKAAFEMSKEKNYAVHAVTFQTTLHPATDVEITRKLARDLGVTHHVIQVDELQHAGILSNQINRCYLCKKYLFGRLRNMAEEMGISLIMDGTNGDDMKVYRPGIRALRELQIVSPLAEAGMTKDDIRSMAAEYGLSVADRPSAPCLATRFPYGTPLSQPMMRKVEKGEEFLKSLGFYNVRLRVHGELARIEVDRKDLPLLLHQRDSITNFLKKLGYVYITLDLEGFHSGSMDRNIEPKGEWK